MPPPPPAVLAAHVAVLCALPPDIALEEQQRDALLQGKDEGGRPIFISAEEDGGCGRPIYRSMWRTGDGMPLYT